MRILEVADGAPSQKLTVSFHNINGHAETKVGNIAAIIIQTEAQVIGLAETNIKIEDQNN